MTSIANCSKILVLIIIALAWKDLAYGKIAKSQPTNQEKMALINSMYSEYLNSFKDVPAVDPADDSFTFDQAVLVDVRELEERNVSEIKNAISKTDFEKNIEKYKGRKIIAYCAIGYRSGLFVKILRTQGFEAYNLKGGILLWVHAGKSVMSNEGPSKKVHVYGKKWDLLPTGWEAVY